MVEQTSASDRIEAARKALAGYDRAKEVGFAPNALVLADALRALITPPAVGESEEQIAQRIITESQARGVAAPEGDFTDYGIALTGVRAGIQAAHETWEPEVAQRPSQEQMLRWLGISFGHNGDRIEIHHQSIEKEVL